VLSLLLSTLNIYKFNSYVQVMFQKYNLSRIEGSASTSKIPIISDFIWLNFCSAIFKMSYFNKRIPLICLILSVWEENYCENFYVVYKFEIFIFPATASVIFWPSCWGTFICINQMLCIYISRREFMFSGLLVEDLLPILIRDLGTYSYQGKRRWSTVLQ
jgi:hypothetical protein